jgi:hypothetical protein
MRRYGANAVGPIVILLLFCSFQIIELDNLIFWDQKRVLDWGDFRVKYQLSKAESNIIAKTSCYLRGRIYIEGNILHFQIRTVLHKNESWVKNNYKVDYVLQHEQGHYDIAEINCRKFRKAVTQFQFTNLGYRHELDSIRSIYDSILEEQQGLYDLETNHANNGVRQREWSNRINQELVQWQEYSNPNIDFIFK